MWIHTKCKYYYIIIIIIIIKKKKVSQIITPQHIFCTITLSVLDQSPVRRTQSHRTVCITPVHTSTAHLNGLHAWLEGSWLSGCTWGSDLGLLLSCWRKMSWIKWNSLVLYERDWGSGGGWMDSPARLGRGKATSGPCVRR